MRPCEREGSALGGRDARFLIASVFALQTILLLSTMRWA